jgi:hypothetical protein
MDSGNSDLQKGIWGSSPSDIFVVGFYSATGSADIILHYDGRTWSNMTTDTEVYTLFNGVWGNSPSDVFAVGGTQGGAKSIILHYAGE